MILGPTVARPAISLVLHGDTAGLQVTTHRKYGALFSIISGAPSQLVFTSPSLNHNLAHYNLTWRTESFSPILAYKLRFKLAKVKTYFTNQFPEDISQVENNTNSPSPGEWSEVTVPVPYLESFSSSWFYTFPFLESGTVYDIIGLGTFTHIYVILLYL